MLPLAMLLGALAPLGYSLQRGAAAVALRGLARGKGRASQLNGCAAEPGARTRFAPSPTGSLHVGGARTALYSWLWARQNQGHFIIRVEDTDTARSTRASEEEVLADLSWLGLEHDEGPTAGGPDSPYRQSERMETGLYQELAQQLVESGAAYPCFCTQEELDAKRLAAEQAGDNPKYDGTWRDAEAAEVARRMEAGEPYTVRFKVPPGKKVKIDDAVRGEVEWDVEVKRHTCREAGREMGGR
jgi:glutamyl-tRNA synthetase